MLDVMREFKMGGIEMELSKMVDPALNVHVVTLACKDQEHAGRCLEALANYGRPDAMSFNCVSYDFGTSASAPETVYIIERWNSWADLDALLHAKVIPALPLYNELLERPFDPARDTVRIELTSRNAEAPGDVPAMQQ